MFGIRHVPLYPVECYFTTHHHHSEKMNKFSMPTVESNCLVSTLSVDLT